MPTGYTAILQEKPDLPFEEFVLRCARAFGACIMQRDDPTDALPNMDEQPSDYHVKAREDAINTLRAAEERTPDQWRVALQDKITHLREDAKQSREKRDRWKASYERMLAKVVRWTPPTEEHAGLKKFMAEQITESIKWDCDSSYYESAAEKYSKLTPQQFRDETIAEAKRSIEYHSKEHREEVERVECRNRWKRQLVESLKAQ